MPSEITVRPATAADHGALKAAIIDLQEYERALHDSRRPGLTIADAYVPDLVRRAAARQGLIVIAEEGGRFAGYAAGWVQEDDTLAETPDSNRYGYVFDCYVVPARRGLGIAGKLLAAMEAHLWKQGVTRIRIGSLATNLAALQAYRRQGFVAYEMVLEKRRPT
ncbi:GNAT family N-acetyltransferase [Desertibaculum subflavum]|uniref:GNAT family N-acetyltransferase n=1 Tax=Desertibaculum subflavum TaxID=2268458 RepID=UPI000E6644B2